MHPAPSLREAFPKTDEARSSQKRPMSPEPGLLPHDDHTPSASPPLRKDTASSNSTSGTVATEGTITSAATAGTSYSADSSPNFSPNHSVFSARDGTDLSHRRNTRRRTGPLSSSQREKAALIRKIGACQDCKRRRVGCVPEHHGMTYDEAARKHRGQSPPSDFPSLGRHISPAPLSATRLGFAPDPVDMDLDSTPTPPTPRVGMPVNNNNNNNAHVRKPLPTGPTTSSRNLERLASAALPGIDTIRADIAAPTGRIISNPHRSRYSSARVLAFVWQDDQDHTVARHIDGLGRVLRENYSYTFDIERIPSASQECQSPYRWMSKRLTEFIDDRDRRDVLKIVFYSGYSYLDANRDMVLAMSDTRDNLSARSTIKWDGLQHILEDGCSDTLIFMDAAYYPSSRMSRQRGVLEFVAASASESHFRELGRNVFTRTITDLLRSRAQQQKFLSPFSAAELHAKLLTSFPSLIQDRNPEQERVTSFPMPLHIQMSGSVLLPSILIAPITRTSLPFGSDQDPSGPQITLTIRLNNDDLIDQDSWTEWIRAMPAGIKDVRMDAPQRNTFR